MRPIYETESDRVKEDRVAELTSKALGVRLVRNPRMYVVDYCSVRGGNITSFVEIKCRDNPIDRYPSLILSYLKYRMGLMLAAPLLKFIVIARWTDGIGWIEPKGNLTPRMGGRTDRNDPEDMEPVVDLPMDEFTMIPIERKPHRST